MSLGNSLIKGLKHAILPTVISLCIGATGFGVGYAKKYVFQVKTGYGVVLKKKGGERVALTKVGWYCRAPLITEYKEYPLMNQPSFLYNTSELNDVIAKGGIVIRTSAVTYYEITDLYQFGIRNLCDKNLTPRDLLQSRLDAEITNYIQKTNPEDLIHQRIEIADEIKQALYNSSIENDFGIKVNEFKFLKPTSYIPEVVSANAEKQRLLLEAEGRFAAAEIEAKRIKLLAEAQAQRYTQLESVVKPQTPEENVALLNYLQKLMLWGVMSDHPGDKTWIITDSETKSPQPVFDPGTIKKEKKTIKELIQEKKQENNSILTDPYRPF